METPVPTAATQPGLAQLNTGLLADLKQSRNKLSKDFSVLVSDAEELLRITANYSGQGFGAARASFEQHLQQFQQQLADAESYVVDQSRAVAQATDRYVHAKPWQAIGVAAIGGILIGVLAGRR